MLNDSQQRHLATDPSGSYIVQAPAGSGKTEILTQRYLRLLSHVNAPEQIIALTFTRKAANEMRERILHALQNAARQFKATSSHQQQTLTFAAEALQRDKTMDWKLLQQPGRLRIITIDALCQTLTQAIPLQEKQIPYAKISDNPKAHYQKAARACLIFALEHSHYHAALKTLLMHVDNRQDHLLSFFSDLLAKREQWLRLLYQAKEQDKKTFENALSIILQHELERLTKSIPNEYAQELTLLVRELANLNSNPASLSAPLRDWQTIHDLDNKLAKSLASLLLTSQNTLRKAFDHHVGLTKGDCSAQEYTTLKTSSKVLLGKLDACPGFLEALVRVKNLPAPEYDPQQWQTLQALFTLLPVLAAHLHLVFSEHNEVDFAAISEQALHALGDDESPTDLALYLDNSIHHLLVDEFQDTSIQQFELLSKLVQNFEPNDGKTLFVVGDPMQSIYRFRSAEVGLFLRAKQEGIGPVNLTPLELSSNFRSSATVVDWVNEHFKRIFPHTDDMEAGAISFHPSNPVKPADEDSFVRAHQFANRVQEADAIVKEVSLALEQYPLDTIAILVRSRNQLIDIVRGFRAQSIPFQGVEIHLLAKLPHLRDLWALTQALLMPGNRLAWLTLLRSPWCGATLSDLHALANFSKRKSIYFALAHLDEITTLSKEGYTRFHFIYNVMDHAIASRHQYPLISWIMQTLKQLHLEQILDPTEQNDLEQYWGLLERFEHDGQIEDFTQFSQEFNKLYSQQVVPSRLQIMTVHKSKGLEFDCVVLPGLGSKPPGLDTPMLRWLKIPSHPHKELLLLSPMKPAHQEHCLVYDYLGKLEAEKNAYELQRLLYVAVTRAKKRLYLFDHSEKSTQGSCRHLLQNQTFISPEARTSTTEETPSLPVLHHLPIAFYEAPPLHQQPQNQPSSILLTNNTPRLMGIVAHEILQWIADNHPNAANDIPWALVDYRLRGLGFEDIAFINAQHLIKHQITTFFLDPIGQWLMQPHEDEHNEYELLIRDNDNLQTKIIDRTFIDKGVRWIIDFKTGQDDKQKETHHHQQLSDYASIFTHLGPESISCGIYYLASNRWIAWEYTTNEHRKDDSNTTSQHHRLPVESES